MHAPVSWVQYICELTLFEIGCILLDINIPDSCSVHHGMTVNIGSVHM